MASGSDSSKSPVKEDEFFWQPDDITESGAPPTFEHYEYSQRHPANKVVLKKTDAVIPKVKRQDLNGEFTPLVTSLFKPWRLIAYSASSSLEPCHNVLYELIRKTGGFVVQEKKWFDLPCVILTHCARMVELTLKSAPPCFHKSLEWLHLNMKKSQWDLESVDNVTTLCETTGQIGLRLMVAELLHLEDNLIAMAFARVAFDYVTPIIEQDETVGVPYFMRDDYHITCMLLTIMYKLQGDQLDAFIAKEVMAALSHQDILKVVKLLVSPRHLQKNYFSSNLLEHFEETGSPVAAKLCVSILDLHKQNHDKGELVRETLEILAKLQPASKILQQVERNSKLPTSSNIYVLIKVVSSEAIYRDKVIELLRHVLNKDMNLSQESRDNDILKGMSIGFEILASLFSEELVVREFLLTAFSLVPSLDLIQKLEKFKDVEGGATYLTSKNLGVCFTASDDLAMLCSEARCNNLSWNLPWPKLHSLCIKYLENPTGMRQCVTELEHLHPDFSNFAPSLPEKIDCFFNSEKGCKLNLPALESQAELKIKELINNDSDEARNLELYFNQMTNFSKSNFFNLEDMFEPKEEVSETHLEEEMLGKLELQVGAYISKGNLDSGNEMDKDKKRAAKQLKEKGATTTPMKKLAAPGQNEIYVVIDCDHQM